jgi:hypothetical protein
MLERVRSLAIPILPLPLAIPMIAQYDAVPTQWWFIKIFIIICIKTFIKFSSFVGFIVGIRVCRNLITIRLPAPQLIWHIKPLCCIIGLVPPVYVFDPVIPYLPPYP